MKFFRPLIIVVAVMFTTSALAQFHKANSIDGEEGVVGANTRLFLNRRYSAK